ncbi:MAG: ATP-binding cassette domain-containing protein [Chitinivibrionales bacterium]|nr:ATP-binding cassette domain-containing protein [Chitinivibrionales bacterium]
MIAFDNVTVNVSDTILLKEIRFTVETGEKTIIGGPSGSGKSTILLTLMGAYAPSSGHVLFNGEIITAQNVTSVRKAVAFIAQEPVLGTGSVREGLLLPFTFKANKHAYPSNEQISEILERLKLPLEILDRDTALVSGGEKQRIAIARALLAGKDIFIVDEITSALDETSNRIVLDLFLQPKFTVLAVSHHPQWLERFDKVITMEHGTITSVHRNRRNES